MNDTTFVAIVGVFLIVGLFVSFAFGISIDLDASLVQRAIQVCEQANSTLTSVDFTEATCANHAVISLYAK